MAATGGGTRQIHILTTDRAMSAGEVVYRMGSRWRQENQFRYARMHFDFRYARMHFDFRYARMHFDFRYARMHFDLDSPRQLCQHQ